jgi:hypothetical protein
MEKLTKRELRSVEGGNNTFDDVWAIGIGILGVIGSGGAAGAIAGMCYELTDEERSYTPSDPNTYRA